MALRPFDWWLSTAGVYVEVCMPLLSLVFFLLFGDLSLGKGVKGVLDFLVSVYEGGNDLEHGFVGERLKPDGHLERPSEHICRVELVASHAVVQVQGDLDLGFWLEVGPDLEAELQVVGTAVNLRFHNIYMVLLNFGKLVKDEYHKRNDENYITMKKYEEQCRDAYPMVEECTKLYGNVDYKSCKRVIPAFQKCFDDKYAKGLKTGELRETSIFM